MSMATTGVAASGRELLAALSRLPRDPAFEALLEGKRIIAVGPARSLVGRGEGTRIDAYDLVVRFNTALAYIPFSPELAADEGTRTDIVYANNDVLIECITQERRMTRDQLARVLHDGGISYLVATNNPYLRVQTDAGLPDPHEQERDIRRFLASRDARAAFRMLYETSELARQWLRGYIARTGFLALLDLLSYPIASLHVTGMTFYHEGGHLFLPDAIEKLHPLGNHRGALPSEPGMPGHNSNVELEVLGQLMRSFAPRLTIDQELSALLHER